jgi:hypothetical protein
MPRKDPNICSTIRDRVDKWEKYWTINRSLYYEWTDFVLGDQWREDESKLFERYNKIPLMVNKLGVLLNHLLGDQMQNTPNLQILPEENVPVETANIRSAIIKNIMFDSHAKDIFQRVFAQSVVGGYSGFRIGLEYENDFTFNQKVIFEDKADPNYFYWDVSARHVCKIDGMYAGFKTRMSRDRFRHRWGRDIESQIGTIAITEDSTVAFADDDSITQVDDFEREPRKVIIRKLSDGSVVDDEEFSKIERVKVDGKKFLVKDGNIVSVIDKRETIHYRIKHRQIAGDFILDESYFPSEYLPIVFLDQKSYYAKQGQQITRSFFKDAKDSQKYLNYLKTQSAYIMKISRYDQFIMPRKCAANPDSQQQWRDPSVVNGALYYDETPSGAKPEQLRPPELSQSLMMEYERTLMDIQSCTGMYNTQMGEIGNEISGSAIDARTQRGTKNTYVPFNSLNIAIATAGEIVNQMIPEIYNTERTIRLSTADGDSREITLNKQVDEYGIQVENDMTKGRYRIRLKPGPSYEGQKEQALQSLQSVYMADKSGQTFIMTADLYAENLPLDNNLEIRNRLRTLVPPEIIEAGKTGKPLPQKQPQPGPEEVLLQLKKQELEQRAMQAQQEAQLKIQELELKRQEMHRKAIETQQDMTIAFEKLDADKEQAAARLQETMLRYTAEAERVGADLHMNQANHLMQILLHRDKHEQRESRIG